MTKFIISASLFTMALAGSAQAALNASDNASNTPYNDGWQTGDNGGGVWGGGWTLTGPANTTQGGFFIGDSGTNGSPVASPNINSTGSKAFGIYANSSQTSNAVRPFQAALDLGQTFSLDMDNGFLATGAVVGFSLRNGSTNLLEFYYRGGDSVNSYKVNDNAGESNLGTGIGFTQTGLHIDIQLTGTSTYKITVKDLSTLTTLTKSGTFIGSGSGPNTIRLFNFNAGTGNSANTFFNNIAIPTPGAGALAGLGLLAAGRRRR